VQRFVSETKRKANLLEAAREMNGLIKEEQIKQEHREFLFDPLAVAYYSQFNEFDPS
jgi:hypothetical protein